MTDDAPRRTGRWLHSISVVVTFLIGAMALGNSIDGGFKGDGALNLIAAAVAFGSLAILSRPHG